MASPEEFNPEGFGFVADENGDISFITLQTEFQITNFEEYQEWFKALVQVAIDNVGYMPIATFPELPPPPVTEDEDDET